MPTGGEAGWLTFNRPETIVPHSFHSKITFDALFRIAHANLHVRLRENLRAGIQLTALGENAANCIKGFTRSFAQPMNKINHRAIEMTLYQVHISRKRGLIFR